MRATEGSGHGGTEQRLGRCEGRKMPPGIFRYSNHGHTFLLASLRGLRVP
jgi:hypothetical protein